MTAPLEIDGPAAPPRSNGELLFTEPWQSRAFGIVVTLYEAGAFEWAAFQSALIARIGEWERAHPDGCGYNYYEHWLGALEDVLAASGAVTPEEAAERAAQLAQRPPGHDHRDDEHGHTH